MNIKISMDYCADPIWEGSIKTGWSNSSLEYFEKYFSKELLNLLATYRDMWEASNTNEFFDHHFNDIEKYQKSFDLISEKINDIALECAKLCKKEQPTWNIYAYDKVHTKGKNNYKLIEIF